MPPAQANTCFPDKDSPRDHTEPFAADNTADGFLTLLNKTSRGFSDIIPCVDRHAAHRPPMHSPPNPQPRRALRARRLLTAALAAAFAGPAPAATTTTPPLGVFTVVASAGSGTDVTLSTLSFPLLVPADLGGAMTGRITAFTSTTLSAASAGWTAGALSDKTAPCLLQITSGEAAGLVLLLSTTTANTGTTVTLSNEESVTLDLETLGLAVGEDTGDTYRILACDTLSTLFGTPAGTGVLGGATYLEADIVRLYVNGGWRSYYYNTTTAGWRRVGLESDADNIPVRPDSLVFYNRRAATALTLRVLGEAPVLDRRAIVRPAGVSVLSAWWPVDLPLSACGLETITGWASSETSAEADLVRIFISGGWRSYYHDGANWRRVGLKTIGDSVDIPAGSGVVINRVSSASLPGAVTQTLPYDL